MRWTGLQAQVGAPGCRAHVTMRAHHHFQSRRHVGHRGHSPGHRTRVRRTSGREAISVPLARSATTGCIRRRRCHRSTSRRSSSADSARSASPRTSATVTSCTRRLRRRSHGNRSRRGGCATEEMAHEELASGRVSRSVDPAAPAFARRAEPRYGCVAPTRNPDRVGGQGNRRMGTQALMPSSMPTLPVPRRPSAIRGHAQQALLGQARAFHVRL